MLAAKIKTLCDREGIAIYKLEEKLGLGNGVIARWDVSSPRVDTLKKVADYFNCTIDDLLKEEEK